MSGKMQVDKQEISFFTYASYIHIKKAFYLKFLAHFHDIHIHDNVVVVEFYLVCRVVEETSDLGSKVDHIIRFVLFKKCTSSFPISIPLKIWISNMLQ